jgi:hypothetical protein
MYERHPVTFADDRRVAPVRPTTMIATRLAERVSAERAVNVG